MYIHIRKKIVAYLSIMYPHFAEYVQRDGSIIMKLLKVMYGCVQAGKLWYGLLMNVLHSKRYVPFETDPCVMRREDKGMIFIILIYIDDLLIFASKAEMEGLRKLLVKLFKNISMDIGMSLSYLGMQIE